MGQHRCRPDDNRRGRRRRLHDHHRRGGAHWRADKPISTEWATHSYADRHAHQPNAGPGASPGASERPGPKPDHGGTGPADISKCSDSDLLAQLSGTDDRTELSARELSVKFSRADHHYDIGTLAQHHPRAGRHVTAKGSITRLVRVIPIPVRCERRRWHSGRRGEHPGLGRTRHVYGGRHRR
jgi:hypothetical protein